jgi:hypothetical protein
LHPLETRRIGSFGYWLMKMDGGVPYSQHDHLAVPKIVGLGRLLTVLFWEYPLTKRLRRRANEVFAATSRDKGRFEASLIVGG